MNSNKSNWYLLFAVIAVTAVAFFPSLQNGWTNWDDEVYVLDNELIRELNWENVKYWFGAYHHGNYHPFTMISYMWDYSISDLNPNGEVKATVFHFNNYLLHLINTALVFVFVLKLTARKEIAAIVAAIFGVHPLHVESVAWISERKDVLYTFFYVFAMITYLNYLKSSKIKDYFFTLVLVLCSLMSKSAGVVFPLSIVLIDFLNKRSISKKAIIEKIPFFALAIVFGILAIKSQNATDSIAKFETFTMFQRLMFACYGSLIYPLKFIIPTDLSCYHPYPHLVDNGTRLPYIYYVSPAIVAVILGGIAWTYKKTRTIVFGYSFYLVNVALVLQFVSVGSAIYAERYSYAAYIGLAYMAGIGVVWLADNYIKYSKVFYAGISAIIVMFGVISHEQTKTWKDSISLWNQFSKVYDKEPYGETKIAEFYMRFDDHQKTYNQFKKITEKFPASPRAYAGMGNMLGKMGKYQEALAQYNRAEDIARQTKTGVAEIYPNRAITYSILKQYDKAFLDYDKAVLKDPKNYKIRINRAYAYLDNKNYERAIEEYSYVLQFEPQNTNHYFLRGIAHQNLKKYNEAINDYSQAIKYKPNNSNAYHNRAICFEQLGKFKKALNDIMAAKKLGKKENEAYIKKLEKLVTSN